MILKCLAPRRSASFSLSFERCQADAGEDAHGRQAKAAFQHRSAGDRLVDEIAEGGVPAGVAGPVVIVVDGHGRDPEVGGGLRFHCDRFSHGA